MLCSTTLIKKVGLWRERMLHLVIRCVLIYFTLYMNWIYENE